LAKISIDDFYYHIRVKNHEIRIFLSWVITKVLFTVDSFRHFLTSNTLIPDYLQTRFLNYVNFISRIANALLTNHPAEKLNEITDEIKGTKPRLKTEPGFGPARKSKTVNSKKHNT
jgi:hypothetical protein